MEELHYWNITFDTSDEDRLYEVLNELQPGMHSLGRKGYQTTRHTKTTMIEMNDSDALILALKANVTVTKLDKE